MFGLLMGLLGGGAILGGALLGEALKSPSTPSSHSYDNLPRPGDSHHDVYYYDYTPTYNPSTSWPSSRENEEQIFRFDKETGQLEIL